MNANVLIADDHVEVAREIARNLEAYGCQTATANSPDACFAEIEKQLPDLLILDIRFSAKGTEGFDICRAIKASTKTRSILVVLATTYDEIDCQEGLAAGADAFFRTPVDFPALRLHIETMLQARNSAYEVARLCAERQLSKMFSHDLGNALSVLVMGVESLRPQVAIDVVTLKSLNDSVKLGCKLYEAMRARGQGKSEVTSVDPSVLLSECWDLRSGVCANAGVELVIEPCSLPLVQVDAWEVIFSLVELVTNALREFDASKQNTDVDKRTIVLSAERAKDGAVLLRAADNGRGVPQELRGKIFEEGFGTRPELGGSGLGLWLVRQRLAEFGGTIDVISNHPRGSVFIIKLPSR